MIDFRSDNVHSVPDQIINALVDANEGTISSYGGDQLTKRLAIYCQKPLIKDLSSFFVSTVPQQTLLHYQISHLPLAQYFVVKTVTYISKNVMRRVLFE